MLLEKPLYIFIFVSVFFLAIYMSCTEVLASSVIDNISNTVQTNVSGTDLESFGEQALEMIKSAFVTAVQIMINVVNNYIIPFFKKYPIALVPFAFLILRKFLFRR